ncbi:MAG: class I SAM-dependent RNA methyltransferase [Clostridiaceae bacterium]|nr:class I SAM-dependent RNA methyltransferase [Clostridiaceae bacterium]
MKLDFCCPTLFGLEGIVADELRFEGKLEDVRAENGRVLFTGDFQTLAWANLNLRCAERVLVRLGTFRAKTFDQLFEGVRAIRWEDWIPADGAFPVKGHALNSALHSIPDCQKIIKKAVVSRLGQAYGVNWFEESGAKFQIQFSIMHDTAEIFLDTSGAGLHKRGYRANANAAPLRETLAAAMIKVARWRGREPLMDPFCGSGTIPIEAAMIAQRRAPGLTRAFDAEKWACIDPSVWSAARGEALGRILTDGEFDIRGSDIDPACRTLSFQNAKKAGVDGLIRFETADATAIDYTQHSGILFANPPYGERLLDSEAARRLYAALGKKAGRADLKQYYLTSDPEFERYYGLFADKKRKLYNGMLKCDLYMYFKPVAVRKKFIDRPAAPRGGARKVHK